jgi:cellobiose phosphorylase
VLQAGATEQAMTFLRYYSRRRLLGEHVPYPVEAYPEGNQRHLSAESGLYCRIFTEGLFGIRPTGFRSFTLSPRLPDGWNAMALKHVKAFGRSFDITVTRKGTNEVVTITPAGGKPIQKTWAGKTPLAFTLE